MNIVLDPKIRDWVFIPIIYVTMTFGLIRLYFQLYLKLTTQKQKATKQKYVEICDKKLLSKCDKLAKASMFLTQQSFNSRKAFLCKQQTGYLQKKGEQPQADMTKAMMQSQNMMLSSLKGTFSQIIIMGLQMAWVNHFFSGFILAKVPFALTQKFRGMTQNGVDMQNLDVRYVSALSFYFIVMFGMNQIQSLIVNQEDYVVQQQQPADQSAMGAPGMMPGGPMMGMGGMGGQGPDTKKLFTTQIENLEVIDHKFILKNGEDFALAKLRSILKNNN